MNDRDVRPIIRLDERHSRIVEGFVRHGQAHESRVRLIRLRDERRRMGELRVAEVDEAAAFAVETYEN